MNRLDKEPDEYFGNAFARWIEGFIHYPDTPRAMLLHCPTFLMIGANVENELDGYRKSD